MLLSSRIVELADCFDAMAAHRSYRKTPFTPYEALHLMLIANKEKFDPLLIKAFVNTVGMYPAGTVVLLDTNEIGVVTEHNSQDIFRPKVKIVADRDRKRVSGATVDL